MLNIGKYCFNCFKPGHIKKNCKAKVKCYCRQADGSHHTALCFSENDTPNTISSANDHSNALNNTEEKPTCLVKNDTTILLQTAGGCIMNITEGQFCVVNILLDTGSQQMFMSDGVVNDLKLKTLCQVDMGVNAFLNAKESRMKLNEYEIIVNLLTLTPWCMDQRKVITELGVPKSSHIDFLLRNMGFCKTYS